MGLIQLENAIEPVTGVFLKRFTELETVCCVHCGSVIAVLQKGCSRDYQSRYTCPRCDPSFLCHHCAHRMHLNKGVCAGPMKAKIEAAVKYGNGHLLSTWVHKYRT